MVRDEAVSVVSIGFESMIIIAKRLGGSLKNDDPIAGRSSALNRVALCAVGSGPKEFNLRLRFRPSVQGRDFRSLRSDRACLIGIGRGAVGIHRTNAIGVRIRWL